MRQALRPVLVGREDAGYGSGLSLRDPDGIALEFSPRPREVTVGWPA